MRTSAHTTLPLFLASITFLLSVLLLGRQVHGQLLKCLPMLKSGVVSDDAFFSYAFSKSANYTFISQDTSFSTNIDTQLYLGGVSNYWQAYDLNSFYFIGILNVDLTQTNNAGENVQQVLSGKKFDETVSILDLIPFIKNS